MQQYQTLARKRRPLSQITNVSRVYQCICQKQYMTYSALYLHAKLKHNFRIKNINLTFLSKSSHNNLYLNNRQIEVAKIDLKSIRTERNLIQHQIQRPQKMNENISEISLRTIPNNIDQIIKLFRKSPQLVNKFAEGSKIRLIFDLFQQCVNEYYKSFDQRDLAIQTKYCLEADGKMLGYFFNFFVTQYMSSFRQVNQGLKILEELLNYHQLVQLMLFFGVWLKEIGFSPLQVQLS